MKKLFAAVVLLLVVLLIAPSAFAAENVWEARDTTYGATLSGVELEVYTALATAFENGVEPGQIVDTLNDNNPENDITHEVWIINNVYVGTKTYVDDYNAAIAEWWPELASAIDNAVAAFLYDNPELFWVRTEYELECNFSINITQSTITAPITIGFERQASSFTKEARDTLKQELETVIGKLIEETKTKNMSTIEQLAFFDNWLAANNKYNSAAAEGGSSALATDDSPWNATGALLDGKSPVCEGYAKAFQWLCHEVGIPCVQVSGEGIVQFANESEGKPEVREAHMWTAVKIDDTWYLCDPTWDDPIFSTKDEEENLITSDFEFSKREYFMIAQDDAHAIITKNPYNQMPITPPTISNTDYFQPSESNDYIAWSLANSTLTGSEIRTLTGSAASTGKMMIALYDTNNRMIACDVCPMIYWTGEANSQYVGFDLQYMYLAPNFDPAVLAKAVSAQRFVVNETTWVPLVQSKPI